jgi:D-tyrosyl-tRNA(Tyr) deacylase
MQRVAHARVEIGDSPLSAIGPGLLLLVGIEPADTAEDIDWLVRKIVQMRVFEDGNGLMNLSVQEVGGQILVVSQFTLHASTRKGNRPSFTRAARPEVAVPLFQQFIDSLQERTGRPVATGEFGARMKVSLLNDGPVTILVDSKTRE